jgi:cytochrome c oxidase assembly protein subunit 15
MTSNENSPAVAVWLWCIATLIFAMVIVGGATRLTESGLSITEWQPLLGAIPPLSEADWLEAFEKYKLIPEYQLQNKGMSLDEFKFIYWWEWAHRLLGRFIGLAFAVPLVFFVATGRIAKRLWPRLMVLFVLGGLQGALGWYMVASGLSERTDVSQYRLAAHLTLAFALFAAVVWTAMSLHTSRRTTRVKGVGLLMAFLTLLFVQVAAGGFVAGLDAGHASYTWPKMNDTWIPSGMYSIVPAWKNLFENALTTQFNHRILAYLLLLLSLAVALSSRTKSGWFVFAAVLVQASIGIKTVLWQVPLGTALMHQGMALVVLALALWHLRALTREPGLDRR